MCTHIAHPHKTINIRNWFAAVLAQCTKKKKKKDRRGYRKRQWCIRWKYQQPLLANAFARDTHSADVLYVYVCRWVSYSSATYTIRLYYKPDRQETYTPMTVYAISVMNKNAQSSDRGREFIGLSGLARLQYFSIHHSL